MEETKRGRARMKWVAASGFGGGQSPAQTCSSSDQRECAHHPHIRAGARSHCKPLLLPLFFSPRLISRFLVVFPVSLLTCLFSAGLTGVAYGGTGRTHPLVFLSSSFFLRLPLFDSSSQVRRSPPQQRTTCAHKHTHTHTTQKGRKEKKEERHRRKPSCCGAPRFSLLLRST